MSFPGRRNSICKCLEEERPGKQMNWEEADGAGTQKVRAGGTA